MHGKIPARTQEERSAATQKAIMEATVGLLLTVGYSRLTTPEIARKAGVSRGALTYQFSSKEDVVAASIRYQLQQAVDQIDAFSQDLAKSDATPETLIDFLWELMSDGLFYVTLEYLPEVRHNPAFRQKILETGKAFHSALDEAWTLVAPKLGVSSQEARVTLNATMCLIRGMLAQTVTREDQAYFRELLDFWKQKIVRTGKA